MLRFGWFTVVVVLLVASGCVPSDFDQPYPDEPVELPRDDAPHEAPIECCSWFGHLEAEDGARHAFQLTFFKAHPPPGVRSDVVPLFPEQEMDTRASTRIVYWEGAVEVRGSRPGVGFVELTNYDRSPFVPGRR
jgi:predicted secreted hydrolase